LNLFIASFRFREPVVHLYRACLPWLGLYLIALVLVTYLPELSLWLVHLLGVQ
jgi:TRAP-type C4-dicarboxylate transport system permease large subunit